MAESVPVSEEAATDMSAAHAAQIEDYGSMSTGRTPAGSEVEPSDSLFLEPAPERLARVRSQQLRTLPVTYTRPDALPFGQSTQLKLVIASKDLDAAIADVSASGGPIETQPVEMARRVKVVLVGPKDRIDITPESEAVRDVTPFGNVTWIWSVTPKQPGNVSLRLAISTFMQIDGSATEVEQQVYTDDFPVTLTKIQWLGLWFKRFDAFWTWLVAFVPVVLAAGAWIWRKSRPAAAPGA